MYCSPSCNLICNLSLSTLLRLWCCKHGGDGGGSSGTSSCSGPISTKVDNKRWRPSRWSVFDHYFWQKFAYFCCQNTHVKLFKSNKLCMHRRRYRCKCGSFNKVLSLASMPRLRLHLARTYPPYLPHTCLPPLTRLMLQRYANNNYYYAAVLWVVQANFNFESWPLKSKKNKTK